MIKCNVWLVLVEKLRTLLLFVKLSQVHCSAWCMWTILSQVHLLGILFYVFWFIRCVLLLLVCALSLVLFSFSNKKYVQFFMISDTHTLAANQPIDLIWFFHYTQQQCMNKCAVQWSVWSHMTCMRLTMYTNTRAAFLLSIIKCFVIALLFIWAFIIVWCYPIWSPDLFSINFNRKQNETKIMILFLNESGFWILFTRRRCRNPY